MRDEGVSTDLDSVCDYYENVDQAILREAAGWGTRCGLTIGRSEVVDALAGLIADGLAKAYDLSACEPLSRELPGMPPLEVVEEDFRTYFLATEKGLHLQLSDVAWWPSDDEDNLRPDWRLDPAQ